MSQAWYTVFGVYAGSEQPWADSVLAGSPAEAIGAAQTACAISNGFGLDSTPLVGCQVVAGQVEVLA